MRRVLAIVLWLLAVLPAAAFGAFYDQSGELVRFTSQIKYRTDLGAETDIAKILAAGEGWVSQAAKPLGASFEPVRLWARFDLSVEPSARRYFVVNGPWESEEYFFVRDGQVVGHQWAGTLVPQSRRSTHIMASSFILSGFVSVDVPANARTTAFVRVANDNRFTELTGLRYSLWDEETVRREDARDRLVQGVFLGIMLLLVTYNLAMYFLDDRDATYLYYVVGLVSIAAMWVSFSGLGRDLLWAEHPEWDHYCAWIATPLGVFSIAQFVRGYLDLRTHLPRLDRHLKWVAIAVALMEPVFLLMARLSVEFREVATLVGFVFIPAGAAIAVLYVCAIALKRKLPYARFFSLALACAVLGALLAAVATMGGWPPLIQAHQAGAALMGIILSIGMGFRMRDLRAELAAKKIEEARIEAERRQHEIASRHKSEFLANMSHELRTPLNAIIGFSEVMTSGMAGPLSEKQKEFTGDIRDSGKHLLGLINDILDLSKIEAGRMELDRARFNLRVAIDNAVTLVRGRADRHGIRLETIIGDDVAEYDGDERKFKQIVLNLLTNAVKFTPGGGTVTMQAGKSDGGYVFSVSDTGVGIAPEDHEKVFEEFRQVGNDIARRAEGTGLGLTLTRKLVELHGGSIRLKSALGQGSVFTFNLPIPTP